jgi:hypothetical protein
MDYHELKLMLETPPVKLLRAQNAPLLLGFLHQVIERDQGQVIEKILRHCGLHWLLQRGPGGEELRHVAQERHGAQSESICLH